jgi:hypothetical protein
MTERKEMPEEILEPCPFCGSKRKVKYSCWSVPYEPELYLDWDVAEEDNCYDLLGYEISCGCCGCELTGETQEDVIKAWNTRADLTETPNSAEVQRVLARLCDVSKRVPFLEEYFQAIMREGHEIDEETGEEPDTVTIKFSHVYSILDICMFLAVNETTIRKALTAQKAEDRQPIETAPKDGTEIIVFDSDDNADNVFWSKSFHYWPCWHSIRSDQAHEDAQSWIPKPPKQEGA